MKKLKLALSLALLLLAAPAAAQFANQHPDGVPMPPAAEAARDRVGGPVALGQLQAQRGDDGRVAIVQAAPAPAQSGGIIQLSAFGWLQPYVDTAAQTLLIALMGWLTKNGYTQWMDASSRATLQTFVLNRASSLIADGAVHLKDKSVRVDNAMLFRAASESATAIPDALKRFGLTPDVVAAKIIDAIPQTQAGAAIIATAHTEEPAAAPVPVTDRPSSAPQVATPNNPPTVGT